MYETRFEDPRARYFAIKFDQSESVCTVASACARRTPQSDRHSNSTPRQHRARNKERYVRKLAFGQTVGGGMASCVGPITLRYAGRAAHRSLQALRFAYGERSVFMKRNQSVTEFRCVSASVYSPSRKDLSASASLRIRRQL